MWSFGVCEYLRKFFFLALLFDWLTGWAGGLLLLQVYNHKLCILKKNEVGLA